jgi:glycosyltransferase involved in cell wall biosynthesis
VKSKETNSRPLISVVVAFLNEENFLQQAADSVFEQSYSNWELLFVDDGSTDASAAIAGTYVARRPDRVRYLRHANGESRGASAARNLGMQHSKGEYIAFLDADDVLLPQALERQQQIMHSQPRAGMVCGRTQWWFSWKRQENDDRCDYTPPLSVQTDCLFAPPALLTMFLSGEARVPCTCSVLIRREVFHQTAGFEETFRGLYDDQAFYAKICVNTPVFVSGECWSKYRQHDASLCSVSRTAGQRDAARLFYLDWLQRYLASKQINDAQLWTALRSKQRRHKYSALFSLQRFLMRIRS